MDSVLQWVAFLVFAPLAVLAGVQVFRVMSMVQAALYLFASFVMAAGLFFVLGAEFLGAIQILMMVGEMAIMALFMVMYMHMPGGNMQMNMSHQKNPARAVAVLIAAGMGGLILTQDWGEAGALPPDQIADLGHEMLGRSMIIFETAAVAILVAMIGAIMLAKRGGRYSARTIPDNRSRALWGGGVRRPVPDERGHDHDGH